MRQKKSECGRKLAVGLCALMLAAGSASAAVTGQWDFTGGLAATVGADIQYSDATVAGATMFGKTSAYSIPTVVPTDAGGTPTGAAVDANVMSFPAAAPRAGYKMWPGAAANGTFSGGDVNHYSLLMDVYYPTESNNKWRALFQTSAANSNDADFFVGNGSTAPSPNGIGIFGVYNGTILPDTWYRIALVVDLDTPVGTPTYYKYINGVLVGSQEVRDARFAPWSVESGNPSWIFSDEDGDTAAGFVDHVRFYDTALSPNDVGLLGGITNGPVVPEPATLTLLGLGVAALLRRRR